VREGDAMSERVTTDDEMARIRSMSDDEIDAELHAEGVDPEALVEGVLSAIAEIDERCRGRAS
jgi:hypothetical protein